MKIETSTFQKVLQILQVLVIPAMIYFAVMQKEMEHRFTVLETKMDMILNYKVGK